MPTTTRPRADAATMQAAVAAFHQAEVAWSAALERRYGRAGSIGYDRGRYRTTYAQWPPEVRQTWAARALAYSAWCAACGIA